jgi:hypothetical protein
MKKVVLIFPSILELVDFTIKVKTQVFEINRTRLSLTGNFSEEDIEVARRGFHATIHEIKEHN